MVCTSRIQPSLLGEVRPDTKENTIRSDEGLALETSALESLYGG